MSPGEKVLVYFGLAKAPAQGVGAAEQVRPGLLRAIAGLVVAGVAFGLVMWAWGEHDPLLKGVLFAVILTPMTALIERLRRWNVARRSHEDPGAT